MRQIKYKGGNFYSFREGVNLSDDKIQRMIDDVVKKLIDDQMDRYTVATGNAIVIGLRCDDEIQIIVSKDYDEATLFYKNGEWVPVSYKMENRRDYLEELSRSELIDLVLRSEYNPRKEV